MLSTIRKATPRALALFAILIAAGYSSDAAAQDAPGEQVAPEARQLLNDMVTHYAELKNWHGQLDVEYYRAQNGREQTMTKTAHVAFGRPDKLSVRVTLAGAEDVYARDGSKEYSYVGRWNKYLRTSDAEATAVSELAAEQKPASMTISGTQFMGSLFAENAMETLMEGVSGVTLVGDAEVNGRPAHQVQVEDEAGTRDYYVDKETNELLRMVVRPDKSTAKAVTENAGLRELKVVYTMTVTPGEGELRENTFAPEAPKEAVAAANAQELQDPVGGKMADFELPALQEDKTVKLSDFRGKVVFVDFFATWCGPCRMEIPHLQDLYEEYGEKGFTVLAVNVGESREVAAPFVKNMGMTMPVALDTDSALMSSAGFNSFPTLAVLDTEGRLVKIHKGYRPGLEKQLAALIEELLEAKAAEPAE